ncbi:glycosyltransferase family 2 protein [Flaviramulus aquimarinus]|uniref:Glycosyltransferase family 2 protein n=1 Tax=Flaviramulus aquimarinus TaxID=1170456 RepID=A0ABP9ET74_9FLAO
MPFFSVVIPLYNKEKYIENTLKSVFNQTFRNFEIVVIDDGSTDKSLEIAKQNLKAFENYKIIIQKNKGLSATRNIGVSNAKGDVIAFLDADDFWHTDFLKRIYNLYLEFPEASLFGTSYFLKYSDKVVLEITKNIDAKLNNKSLLITDFFESNLYHPIACQSSIAIKKLVFEDIIFDESINYSEDIDFYIKSNLNYKFAYFNSPLVTILLNIPDQITRSGIKGKTIPDLNKYEKYCINNVSLKKYLDFYRYTFLIQYKLCNDSKNYKSILEKIDINNLTFKQKFLIKCPVIILKLVKWLKKQLLKYNIQYTSF